MVGVSGTASDDLAWSTTATVGSAVVLDNHHKSGVDFRSWSKVNSSCSSPTNSFQTPLQSSRSGDRKRLPW